MKIPSKRLTNGFKMPVFGLGTWMMGTDKVWNPFNYDRKDIQAIKNAIESGITHIDTAENYAQGRAEKLVGKAIKGYEREKLMIVSKVDKRNLRYNHLINSCKGSLKRIETDYLDLYLIHAPNPEIDIKETMAAMDFLLDKGLIKNIGISNFSVERTRAAQACTKNEIVANQLHYNLIYREMEKKGLVEYCQKKEMLLIAWRPVQKGILSQKGTSIVDKICQKYNKTPAQIAINWLISQKNVVTLSKMSDPLHLKENLGAIGWQMEKGDIEKLRKEFPEQEDESDVVPLI